jgi:hypothetical protein
MSAAVGQVPVLKVHNPRPRSRLTTLVRLILAIPWLIVQSVWGFLVLLCTIVAWFVLLFTGRYPAGLYEFVANYVRFSTRAFAFTFLLADPFPPFDGTEHPEYPTELQLGPPLPAYSRLKVLLRILYMIPAYIVGYIAGIILYIAGFISWLVILVTGAQPDGLQNVLRWALSWQMRYLLLLTLVRETYDLQVA